MDSNINTILPNEAIYLCISQTKYTQCVRRTCSRWYELLKKVKDNDKICKAAAKDNAINVIIWAREQGYPWDTRTYIAAAVAGNREIVQWLKANGCPTEPAMYGMVASAGKMEMLEWLADLHKDDENLQMGSCVYYGAMLGGHFDIVKRIREMGMPWSEDAGDKAVINGSLEVLEWMYADGCVFTPEAIKNTVYKGRIDVCRWLVSIGIAVPDELCTTAASGNQLEMLKYLHTHGHNPMTGTEYMYAVIHKNEAMFNWLLEVGCPRTSDVLVAVAYNADYDSLIRLVGLGFPMDGQAHIGAASAGHLDVIDWLIERGAEPPIPFLIGQAVVYGHIPILERYKTYIPGLYLDQDMIEDAVEHGRTEVLEWMVDNCDGASVVQEALKIAMNTANLTVIRWTINILIKRYVERTTPDNRSATYVSAKSMFRDILVNCNSTPFISIAERKSNNELIRWIKSLDSSQPN